MPRKPVIDSNILQAALAGLEAQRDHVDGQIDRVRQLLGSRPPRIAPPAAEATAPATETKPARKRRLSAAGRKAIALAAKKRWADQRQREKEEAKHEAEVKERRIAALAKARKALATSRKAAKQATAKKKALKKAAVQHAPARAANKAAANEAAKSPVITKRAEKRAVKAAKKATPKPKAAAIKTPAVSSTPAPAAEGVGAQ